MSRRRRLEQGSLFVLSLLPLVMAASGVAAQALPSGGSFASGAGTITATSPTLVTIDQSTDKAIVNWNDFSISAGNSVQFNNGTGATLNRVTGGGISNLDGLLGATGSVYLINPNGVIIGSGGVVNVGGTFVASTLNITDANFLAGKGLTFEGASTAAVVNLGQIGALGGDVALIAKTVNNEGVIDAANGSAGLLAGSKVLIRDAMADDGKFVVQVGGAGSDATNIGAINSAVAELRGNGGNVYALAGNVGSGITATSVSNVGGRVFLTAGAGEVTATTLISGDKSVEMSGDHVVIAADGDIAEVTTSKWLIDASEFTINFDEASALNATAYDNTDLEIRTHAGSGSGDIHVWSILATGGALTLSARHDVVVHANLMGLGDRILRADNTGTGAGTVQINISLLGGQFDIYTNASNYGDYASIGSGYQGWGVGGTTVNTHLLVNSYADLQRLNTDTGGSIYGNFAVGRDIDASASADGLYVGASFQGTFDGLGHTVADLHVTGASAGLFTDLNGGNVSNLNLTGSVEGTDYAGAVAGHGYMGSITNVTSSMSVTNTGTNATGGLLGYGTYVSIDGSSASGSVSGAGDVGGLIGRTNDAVRDSFATGAVSGTGDNVGGLVGRADGYLISDSFATGSVSGSAGGSVGGLVGLANDTTFTNVHATGAVNAYYSAGGLVGMMNNGSVDTAWASGDVTLVQNFGGGLVGLIYGTDGAPDIEIRNAYASGSVTGLAYVGGLIGQIEGNGTFTHYVIDNVHATGEVEATDYWDGFAGGLFGVIGQQSIATVSNFYATGSVTGGFAGGVAGLVNDDNTFLDGYVSGAVSGGYQGGLFGYQNPGAQISVTNLYWDVGTTGQASAGGDLTGSYTGIDTADAYKGVGVGSNYTFSDPSQWVTSIDGLRPLLASEYSTTINNVHQLQLIQLDLGETYTLARDISAAETSAGGGSVFGANGFHILGAYNDRFTGQLNGGGHQISGLTMSSSEAALFHSLEAGASIDDLALVGGAFTATQDYSNAAALAIYNYGAVRNVSSSATVNGYRVGGLIMANLDGGVVEGVAVKGSVTGSNAGGIVNFNGGVLRDSYFSGQATALGVAGVALDNVSTGVIQNVVVTGTLTGTYRGAIVYTNGNGGRIEHALWNSNSLGGIAGAMYNSNAIIDARGYTRAQLQDETQSASVYAGFDLDGVWAMGSSAGASSDGQAHFAELYRADNVMMVDARGGGSVYGDAIALNTVLTHGNARDGDVIVAAGQASINATQGSDAGSYALSYTAASGTRANGGAMRVVTLNGDYVIAKRDLTATLTGAVVKTYDGTNVANLTAANLTGLTGTINGDVIGLSGATGTYSTLHAGTGLTVTASGVLTGDKAGNYELTGITSNNGQIDARVLTAGFDGTVSKEYDGYTDHEVGYSDFTLGNKIDGDDVWVDYVEGSFNSSKVLLANSFSVSGLALTGDAAGDYVLANSTLTGAGAIDPRMVYGYLTGSVTKQYDGTDVAHLTSDNYGLEEVLEDDDVKVDGPTTGYYSSKDNNEGSFALTVTVEGPLSLSGADASNYVVYNNGGQDDFAARPGVAAVPIQNSMSGKIGFINRRELTAVIGGSSTKIYDGTTGIGSGNLTVSADIVAGEDVQVGVNLETAAYADKNAGTNKAVIAGGAALSGEDAYNYVLVSDTASGNIGTIDAKAISAGLTGSTIKTYDGATTANLGASNYVLSGLIGDDVVTVAGSANYADKNAGNGKTVTANGLTLSGAAGGNYVLASTTASGAIGAIDAKAITAGLTGTVTKVYDGSTTATLAGGNYGLTGVVGGDTVTVASTGSVYGDKNVGAGKTVTVSGVTIGGGDSGNYVLTSTTASAAIGQIDAKTLTAGLTGSTTKVYDGSTTATLTSANYGLTGVIGGETVTLASTGAAYGDKNAGAGKTVTASGVTLGGADSGNYVLASTTASGSIGQIDAKTLTAGLTGSTTKVYDSSTTATLTSANYGLTGVIGDETVTLASTGAAYGDKNAGTGKTVTASGVSLGGADSGNYVLASTTASGSIGQIDAKVLTAGLTGSTTKVYDGSTTATLTSANYGLTGVIGDETVTLASTGAAYGDKNAGAGKSVTASGVSLGGADSGNYVLASTTASGSIGTITPRDLAITAEDKTKNRNDVDPLLTYTAGAMVAGDSLTGSLTREVGESVGAYGILQGTLSAGGNYAVTFKPAVFTIALGIPPVEGLVIPYLPAEGGGETGQGSDGQDAAPNSAGFLMAQQGAAPPSEDNKDDTTSCSTTETCQTGPYAQGGSTSGSIHFQGYMH